MAPQSPHIHEPSDQDRLVVVMGPTGAGKSSFISIATNQCCIIGHGLESCTSEIQPIRVTHPDHGRVTFVDTPGFDDTYKSDIEILGSIADWFVRGYQKDNIAGILYFHRISDPRVAGSALKTLHTFAGLCGMKAMPNVTLVTTFWTKIDDAIGERRESELKSKFWKELEENGCRISRFEDSVESAWEITKRLLDPNRERPQLPKGYLLSKEIVVQEKRLNETKAGVALTDELKKFIAAQKEADRRLRELVGGSKALSRERTELEGEILNAERHLHARKVPLLRHIRNILKTLAS